MHTFDGQISLHLKVNPPRNIGQIFEANLMMADRMTRERKRVDIMLQSGVRMRGRKGGEGVWDESGQMLASEGGGNSDN